MISSDTLFVSSPRPLFFQVRSLAETVRLDSRTKLLNPKWYEGMMASGYEGVREIQKRLTNTLGWSATSGQVCTSCHADLSFFHTDCAGGRMGL